MGKGEEEQGCCLVRCLCRPSLCITAQVLLMLKLALAAVMQRTSAR